MKFACFFLGRVCDSSHFNGSTIVTKVKFVEVIHGYRPAVKLNNHRNFLHDEQDPSWFQHRNCIPIKYCFPSMINFPCLS
jgi:hypothetical protein